ncbi:MAG: DUF2088 domain-containing protein [Anaerolineae bacterium]|nr:DUF2088 domain-containing protein [Anaerolineae bacterium]
MTHICIPWHSWYGDHDLALDFPKDWRVRAYWPADGPDMDEADIEAAMDAPIGTPTLESLARQTVAAGKRTVSIAVDDISRPTPAARLMPLVMQRLEAGGIDLDDVKVVLAVGMHRLMTKEEMRKKLGDLAVERLDIYNSFAHDGHVDYGFSSRGTPIKLCRQFAEGDLKIGIGSIMPHGGPGFGGGAKVVFPGVASYETVASMHKPGRLGTGLLNVDHNELRADIEEMGRKVGLDVIINLVLTSRRGIAGVYVGDFVQAHRAGVEQARAVYATKMPEAPVDIAICNAYPKDTDFLQAGLGLNVIASAELATPGHEILKPGATVVLISASPEGRGHHALYSTGMIYGRREGDWRSSQPMYKEQHPIVYLSPHVTRQDARCVHTYSSWGTLQDFLASRYTSPNVAVFPCGANQIAV